MLRYGRAANEWATDGVLDFGNGSDPILGLKAVDGGSVLEGELHAIRLGLAAARAARPGALDGRTAVMVRSDCQDAVRMLAEPRFEPTSANGRCVAEAARIRSLVRCANVDFDWVKGHAGDPLNTAADRLAVLARRTREARLTAAEAARLAAGVQEEAIRVLRARSLALTV